MSAHELTDQDVRRLESRGIRRPEAERQLALLRAGVTPLELVRPCTPGDGIERLGDDARSACEAAHGDAAARGEVGGFVPASGAATRMFRELLAYRADPRALTRAELESDAAAGRADANAMLAFVAGLPRFAFRGALAAALDARGTPLDSIASEGPYRSLLAALLDSAGLGYATLPKALVPFHDSPSGPRTAFEEHLEEAARLYADPAGRIRVHVTVSHEHEAGFRALLTRTRARDHGSREYDVAFSAQEPATDTLAIDAEGAPFRDDAGELVLRPSGHGALLRNLAAAATPIVMIKNIDNVAAGRHREPTWIWTRALVGRLALLRSRTHELLRRLKQSGDADVVDDAVAFARTELGVTIAAHRDAAHACLDRPLRVCGMVPNTGEPGGGPFWVRDRNSAVTRQIVESAQVASDAAQQAVFRAATHFNPVYLACAFDDAEARRYELDRFVDPGAAFITGRSSGGRELIALERPGLWNGGMAHWNTVFVEVPLTVFNPVKTVLDLLRPAHQAE